METTLCPAQQRAFDGLMRTLPVGSIFVLQGETGMGKSTVLRELHRAAGGAMLTMKQLVDATRHAHPLAMEEVFEQLVRAALADHDVVIVDDTHLFADAISCEAMMYPRRNFLDAPLAALTTYAAAAGKKLVFAFGQEERVPGPIHQRCSYQRLPELTPADYEFLCRASLAPAAADRLEFQKIHRFAPKLNAHQLKGACEWLKQEEVDTERFIEYLKSERLASNLDLGEVQAVDLHDLKGVDDVIRSLEANIILPLENDDLAAELDLKPKRGVLLAGPPGTGKTTVGRALARRLKSKFFLIDGTFISGTHEFYGRVQQVFEAAKQNAPCIIFVDDSDAIFESGEELGLYRYLLTMLDGLESESAGRVCVMMTAMDVGNLPPALLRSGRVELWLEMRLPDEEARAEILHQHLSHLPAAVASVDMPRLVAATDGFTGADLKRLLEDGKNLYAYDKARGLPLQSPSDYFVAAVETVRANKQRYAEAEARSRDQQRPPLPPWFGTMAAMRRARGRSR